MNIEAIRLHAQNKGDLKLLKLIEGAVNKRNTFDYNKEYELHLESGIHKAEFQGYCFANDGGTFCVGIECVKPSPAMSASNERKQ